jgi:hypothetical protein
MLFAPEEHAGAGSARSQCDAKGCRQLERNGTRSLAAQPSAARPRFQIRSRPARRRWKTGRSQKRYPARATRDGKPIGRVCGSNDPRAVPAGARLRSGAGHCRESALPCVKRGMSGAVLPADPSGMLVAQLCNDERWRLRWVVTRLAAGLFGRVGLRMTVVFPCGWIISRCADVEF